MDQLILKRASASRPSGEWNEDDFDVLADGAVVGRIFKANAAPVGSPGCGHWPSGITKIARRHMATLQRATPRWRHSLRTGGVNDQSAPRLPAPHSWQSGDKAKSNFGLRMAERIVQFVNLKQEIHRTGSKLRILGFEPLK
jgi:hypothetical protein